MDMFYWKCTYDHKWFYWSYNSTSVKTWYPVHARFTKFILSYLCDYIVPLFYFLGIVTFSSHHWVLTRSYLYVLLKSHLLSITLIFVCACYRFLKLGLYIMIVHVLSTFNGGSRKPLLLISFSFVLLSHINILNLIP